MMSVAFQIVGCDNSETGEARPNTAAINAVRLFRGLHRSCVSLLFVMYSS